MMHAWILVANRSEAKLFAKRGFGTAPRLIRELQHPEGRLHARDIDTDRPGRTFDGRGAGRHAYTSNPKGHHAEIFAKELSTLLDRGMHASSFRSLIIIAEPQMLGLIRGSVHQKTAASVVSWVGKDLPGVRESQVDELVSETV